MLSLPTAYFFADRRAISSTQRRIVPYYVNSRQNSQIFNQHAILGTDGSDR